MSTASITPPFNVFSGVDGLPLEDGNIYIGETGKDPETFPIAVYWDNTFTTPAAQPIKTIGGYPSRSGSPGRLYAQTDFSIKVEDKNGTLVYISLSGNVLSAADIVADDGASGTLWTTIQGFINKIISSTGASVVGRGASDVDADLTALETDVASLQSGVLIPSAAQGRCPTNYGSATTAEVWVPDEIVMAGFRYKGSYKKSRAVGFSSGVNGKVFVSLVSDLAVETTVTPHNWYAVFAVANNGDTDVTYVLMPILRVGSVAASSCTLTYAGEGTNSHSVNPIVYTWANDALNGADCLVINEGSNNRFSGRVTTVTDSTPTTVTLDTIGSVGPFDFILVAPPGWDHYAYLGSFYRDSAEPRNIADNGIDVQAFMISTLDPNWLAAGAMPGPPGNKISLGGYISPLATAAILYSGENLSTGSTGISNLQLSHDSSNHVIQTHYLQKEAAATFGSQRNGMLVSFSISQFTYAFTTGSLAGSRSACVLAVRGWVEP